MKRGLLGAILVLSGCTAAPQVTGSPMPAATATATPSPTATGGPAIESQIVDIDDVEVDDCHNPSPTGADSVEVVDCARPHVYQVFALVDHPAGGSDPFPGDAALSQFALDECRERFDAYVDFPYAESVYYIFAYKPSADTWAAGDREVICNLRLEDDSQWTGSGEGDGR
jgi:hypothetical protein